MPQILKEKWKPILKVNSKYAVSNFGRIKSLYRVSKLGKIVINETILKPTINRNGYYAIKLGFFDKGITVFKTYKIHRLVAEIFIHNPDNKPEVNHKDLNKLNNCAKNLEWNTSKENANHYYTVTGKWQSRI